MYYSIIITLLMNVYGWFVPVPMNENGNLKMWTCLEQVFSLQTLLPPLPQWYDGVPLVPQNDGMDGLKSHLDMSIHPEWPPRHV